jgi:uncharacterized integral membrane protein (TIGR00698 family)
VVSLAESARIARVVVIVALSVACLTPWITAPWALAAGAAIALGAGNPFPQISSRVAVRLLQASVVGLGCGMSLARVVTAGASGVGYTIAGIAVTLAAGSLLGRLLRVERETSWLVTGGTAICGGSAIAAIGAAIGARRESLSVALGIVFLLNAVALYAFPPLGHALGMSQQQFAVWAAVAIHDTASVVGASAIYGEEALETATVLKLARALWIAPLALLAAAWSRRATQRGDVPRPSPPWPWFIALFVLATLIRSVWPAVIPAFDVVAQAARKALVLTLFLIGLGLTPQALRSVGPRPLLQGVALWLGLSVVSAAAILFTLPP